MSRSIRIAAVALLALAAACADQEPTAAGPGGTEAAETDPGEGRSESARAERLARRLALALADSAYRAELHAELQRSPVAEQKLHFQRYVAGAGGRAAERIATVTGAAAEDVTAEALGAVPLELYLPVPAHRAGWTGGDDLLVATALGDHDVPVAFDPSGRRVLLDPEQPPATPVLALVPVETDFDAALTGGANAECQDCGGDGGGTGGTGGDGTSSLVGAGIVMTYATFVEDFEGWLKGAPEFEIHIMGPNSATDTSTARSIQCIGERADIGYRWNMDNLTWTGAVRLFSDLQLAAFERNYPGRAFMITAIEDDDEPCVIKADRDLAAALLKATRLAYDEYNGAKDKPVLTPGGFERMLKAGKAGVALLSAVASLIKTNDELIGVAVADSVAGRFHSKANWTVQNKDLRSNGWLKLEIR
jgi:hypothetical protein